jgi:hypothetical protein
LLFRTVSSLPLRTDALHASLDSAPTQVTPSGGALSEAAMGTPLQALASQRAAARHVFGAGLAQKLQLEDALFHKANDFHFGGDSLAADTLLGFDEMLAPAGAYFTRPGDQEALKSSAVSHAALEKKALRNF